jgi:molecular chaperone GrpE
MSKKPTLDDLADRIDELTEALQRERADAENIRRRHEEQYSALQNLVKAKVIRDLLPALDNLERALKHVPKDLEGNDYVKGVEGTVKQFDKTLAALGVTRIKTVGELFDPALHEAVGMEEGAGEVEVVCEELQPGYTVDGEVIRHAMVKVKMEAKK